MASNCKACSDLREYAPEFVTNGVTDNVFLSLENDNGLGNNEDHTDCDDLVDAVDCLVGNMDDEIEAYEVCSWKDYMHKLVPNLHQTIKAVIGSICGLWNNVCRLWCYIDLILNGINIEIKEKPEGDDAYMVAGRGVSFLIPRSGQPHTSDWVLKSYGANIIRLSGSLRFFTAQFPDEDGCWNYDTTTSDGEPKFTNRGENRKPEPKWDEENLYANHGILALEVRINKEKYPEIKRIVAGHGFDTGGGAYHANYSVFNEGSWAYGQIGSCNSSGEPDDPEYSHGHIVPEGWVYIQVRIKWTTSDTKMGKNDGLQRSPSGFLFFEANTTGTSCGDLGNHENCNLDLHQTDTE